MTLILSVIVASFAAFCLWLTVRIVNRRERWAKWTAAGMLIAIGVGYPLAFGPVCRYFSTVPISDDTPPDWLMLLYAPCGRLVHGGPEIIRAPFVQYLTLWIPEHSLYRNCFIVPIDASSFALIKKAE